METEYYELIRIDGTENATTFQAFMQGLRYVCITYFNIILPTDDTEALCMFEYAGKEEDTEFRERRGISFYDFEENKYTCLCGRLITNLYYIVLKSERKCYSKLVVGSEHIKMFHTKCKCKYCNQDYLMRLGKNENPEICLKCSKCSKCQKKRIYKNLCDECKNKLTTKLNTHITNHLLNQEFKKKQYENKVERFVNIINTIHKKQLFQTFKSNLQHQCRKCKNMTLSNLFCKTCKDELEYIKKLSLLEFPATSKYRNRTFSDVYGDNNQYFHEFLKKNGKREIYRKYLLYVRLKTEWANL